MASEPIGLSINLPAKRVMRAQVGDFDLAVWRSTSGKLSAWNNRCPHRGMRLSHGFVRGEALACLYHGWHYDCQGACRYVPAHPELEPPKTIRTIAHSITEENGLIWVNVDGNAEAAPLPASLNPVRSITFDCSTERAMDVLLASCLEEEDGGILKPVIERTNKPTIIFGAKESRHTVYALLQSPDVEMVTVHILASSGWSVGGLIRISRWAEKVRRLAETDNLVGNAPSERSA